MQAPVLAIDTVSDDPAGICVLRLRGDVDMATAPLLRERIDLLERDGCRNVELDLAEVRFMDSSGLGVLMWAQRRFTGEGRGLVLRNLPANLVTIFEVTGLDRYLHFA